MLNANDIKRYITGGRKGDAYLLLTESGGLIWASNRYWITPATRLMPLLGKFNVDPTAQGTYTVNGSVHKDSDHAPDMARFLDMARFTEVLTPVSVHGHQAYLHMSDTSPYLRLFEDSKGRPAALPADQLDWLSGMYGADSMLGRDEHFSDVRYLAEHSDRPTRPVAIVADVIRTVKPYSYGTDDNGKSVYIPAETENLGARVIGVLMTYGVS